MEQKIWGIVLSLFLCAAVRLYKWNQVLSVSALLCVRRQWYPSALPLICAVNIPEYSLDHFVACHPLQEAFWTPSSSVFPARSICFEVSDPSCLFS